MVRPGPGRGVPEPGAAAVPRALLAGRRRRGAARARPRRWAGALLGPLLRGDGRPHLRSGAGQGARRADGAPRRAGRDHARARRVGGPRGALRWSDAPGLRRSRVPLSGVAGADRRAAERSRAGGARARSRHRPGAARRREGARGHRPVPPAPRSRERRRGVLLHQGAADAGRRHRGRADLRRASDRSRRDRRLHRHPPPGAGAHRPEDGRPARAQGRDGGDRLERERERDHAWAGRDRAVPVAHRGGPPGASARAVAAQRAGHRFPR